MRDGKWFPYIFVFFIGIFGVRKVQCYLSVQVTVLLETNTGTVYTIKHLTLSAPQDVCNVPLSLSGEKRHKTFVMS